MVKAIRKFCSAVERTCFVQKPFNYDHHGDDWELASDVRCGKQQSPIAINRKKICLSKASKLHFLNYHKPLAGPLKFHNTGTTDGTLPGICGCVLESVYQAVQMHFHWGSESSKGAEHTIDGVRHDGELHIVHKNCAYSTKSEAMCSPDGFVVLAILLRAVTKPKVEPVGLNKILQQVKQLQEFGSITTIKPQMKMNELFANIKTDEFFSYKGSLTTPPCVEAVNWFVFPKALEVGKKYLRHFWCLQDSYDKLVINNYRNLQDIHDRTVYFRSMM
ncbi:carbonic anhydrase 6-like isoform X2 [Scaptodrosophila lebanonensis]|uniref:Carbonic anhydrase 6-like isoform X2 n=1 Tax=Drosophila lebanonensis TaxID=7225 RepID=A0A6J2TIU4_DROLE|nr:carbonic anhydrase 6-like isoform X2 [Scaptodrosophila lebanonensis]